MFTGIVQGLATITSVEKRPGLGRLLVAFPGDALKSLTRGASIALDGVCLTVTDFDHGSACFDVMHETLRVSTLGTLASGCLVNFERAAADGAEVGGHVLSGHIDCVARISELRQPANNHVLTFTLEPQWFRYIFSKGYIAVNGTSLTITNAQRENSSFDVWLIPETLKRTTFSDKKVGELVNIEIERQTQVIVDTVTNFMRDHVVDLQRMATGASSVK